MTFTSTEYANSGCRVRYFNQELKEEGYHVPGRFWVQYENPQPIAPDCLKALTLTPAPAGIRQSRRNIEQQVVWVGQEKHTVRYFDAWDREIGYLLKNLRFWVEFETPQVRAQSYLDTLTNNRGTHDVESNTVL